MRYVLVFLLLSGCVFLPPKIVYKTYLTPVPMHEASGRYAVDENGMVATYAMEGLRVKVEYMTDGALDAMFPEDSYRGRFSTNPYTYGDWVDPVLGYTPNRFTTFRVTVINDTYAKVLLDPLKALLYTDRGEVFHAYGIPSSSPYESFERYYRAIRGQSGNEFYRFDLRMGNVRSSAYLQNQKVFKGESYGGLIAFDPLDEEVRQVRLVLREVVLKFDAFDRPLETMDIPFEFNRTVQQYVVKEPQKEERASTTETLRGSSKR